MKLRTIKKNLCVTGSMVMISAMLLAGCGKDGQDDNKDKNQTATTKITADKEKDK